MKTRILILCLFPLLALASTNTVTFNLTDFLGTVETLKRKQVTIQPLSTVRANVTNLITGEIRFFNTGTNGVFIVTNMNEGLYRGTVYGNKTSVFYLNMVDTNGDLFASDFLTTLGTGALETEEGQPIDLE